MAGMLPMAVYGLEVPPGDMPIPANTEIPSAFRITMAAIDPSAGPKGEDGAVPRATLRIIRQPLDDEDDYDEDDEDFDVESMERMLAEDEDDEDEDEDSDDEDLRGGPSDPSKSRKARKEAAEKQIKKLLDDVQDDMDLDDHATGVNGIVKSAKARGKMPASDESDDEEDDDDDEDIEGEWEEFVLCTLDPDKNWQQPLDITVGEREQVLFQVTGTHSIYLTGNYVEPADSFSQGQDMYDPDSDDEEDYDLEPDSDEIDEEDEDEEDELDSLVNPRVQELEDEIDDDEVPELVTGGKGRKDKKGKNKRPAEDHDEATDDNAIDELIAKANQKEQTNGETKLSRKQLKKQKKNDGSANATATEAKKESEALSSAKSDKKVQFAKELEQGPTPTKDGKADKTKASLGVKVVQGVTIDDKKLGSGPAAKKGDRVGMRYIGKLDKDKKVFDSNKKGKPFSFKLGSGEVIKGWEIGIQGLAVGGERRITIPAHLAYGKQSLPGIPANSDLVFDVKLMELNHK